MFTAARFEELLKRSKEEEREYDYTLEFAKRMLQDEQHLCETRKASAINFNEERATLTDTSCKTTDELKSSDSEGNGCNNPLWFLVI